MVRILYHGVLREVVVDDYIPVTPQNTPLFAKPAGGHEVWVMILEKAWAKLHGSYGAIVGKHHLIQVVFQMKSYMLFRVLPHNIAPCQQIKLNKKSSGMICSMHIKTELFYAVELKTIHLSKRLGWFLDTLTQL